ncbi:hypothetical protein ABZZ36_11705 [Actinacidiphila glaucinigra]|uniref:hypothetical protein n=1 Tax=Actinacidiphila glaucinigra TaxID=235986 RepID=UPI0033BDC75A
MPIEPHSARAGVDDLCATLDPLAYPARMKALASWVRAVVRDEGCGGSPLRPLLDELDARGTYERRLAGIAAAVGQDVAFLEARLTDRDPVVRGHALQATLRLPIGDAALERAMDDAPAAVRRKIVDVVVAGGRTALAERLIGPLREAWGDAEAARLLPACGAATVERLLPDLFLAVTRWNALALCHPDLVLNEVARQLATLPAQSRHSWWWRNAEVFAVTAEQRPLRVLDLLEQHCPPQLPGPVSAGLAPLLRAAPGRTVRLLTAPERHGPPAHGLLSRSALVRLARRLAPEELLGLGRAWSDVSPSLARLLRALPPSRREAFYDAVNDARDPGRDTLGDSLLEALPRDRARREARRMAVQAEERGAARVVVLSAVAHLSPAEARPRLLADTRRPAADDRASAYALLVRNAARSGEGAAVAQVLDDLRRLRNEQDPVRSPALAALASTPPRLFSGTDAPLLDRITTDAVEARDSSPRSRQALSQLALAVLREHAVTGERELREWALSTLERICGRTGGASMGRLDTTLRHGQEAQVLDALRPWLEAGAGKADHSLTFALARALGRRARRLPELQELLWRAVRSGDNATVHHAVELWLDDPSTREERVGRLVEFEASAAVLPRVLSVLTRRRTDLLDLVLGETPPYGRFLTPGSRWVPPVDAIGAWLPRQQAAAGRLLARAAGDASLPASRRTEHIRAAARVPEVGLGLVSRYLGSTDTVLAEAALGSLAWTDRPDEALPLLLARAADDRARVALHAASRVTSFVAPSLLEEVLRSALLPAGDGSSAPDAKVTSRKELVRLAASRLPLNTAASILSAVSGLPGQHPDVQAVCVSAAADLLPSPAAWELLEGAADGPPVIQAAVLRINPHLLREDERSRYGRLIGRVAGSAHQETADAATALLAAWSPWYPEAGNLLLTAAVDLDNRTSWRAASDGLVALGASAGGAEPLLQALARLVAAEDEFADEDAGVGTGGLPDAEGERDRPARQRIAHVVARLSVVVTTGVTEAHRTMTRRAAELLGERDAFVPQAARLSLHALDLDAPATVLLGGLEHLAELHSGRPALAVGTAAALRDRLGVRRPTGDPLVLLLAAERLAAEGGHAAGLLAVAVTGALGRRTGWTEEWRGLLRSLRRHALPDVRDAALAVTTAAE